MQFTPNLAYPRSLALNGFRVLAEQSPEQLFRQLREGMEGFHSQHNERLDNVEAALNAIGAGGPNISAPGLDLAVDGEYSRTFASYFRKGDGDDILRKANSTGERATIQAAMSVGDNSAGGYLAPVEWDRKISEAQRATSPMRRISSVVKSSVGAYTTLWNNDLWGSGWVGETAARPQTTTASLAPITFAAGEIYAMPAATQRLLDDAAINVDDWLIQSIQREFNRQEGIAFLSGDGVNKPAGLLTFAEGGSNEASHPGGAIDVTEGAITVDGLIDFLYGLAAPYRQNATWLMSSLTAAVLTKLKDADGNLIWRESLIVGQPSTLLGRPVEIDEGMPGPDAEAMPIAFGDFRAGYLINDRIGTRILRDPFSSKPFVMFYVTKRVGGGLLDPNAIRVLKLPV
jgi:HK97 family phage major capsid protein